MIFLKHRLTIQLVSQEKPTHEQGVMEQIGPDYWVVHVTVTSVEGQSNIEHFGAMHKKDALEKAYAYLTEVEEYRVLSKECVRAARYKVRMVDEIKVNPHKEPGFFMREAPVTPPPITKKWKWYHWFWNPEDVKK